MRSVQRRWVCGACDREWVYSTTGNDACPICASRNIERVEYLPVVQGADICSSSAEWAGAEAIHIPPVIERKELIRDRNEALMRLDPYAEQLSALLGVPL